MKQYIADGDDEYSSPASDVSSDYDAAESDSSYDYKDAQKQLTVAVQKRSEQWKCNGLDKILNDVCFKLSTTDVEDWLKQNCPNSSKQLAMDRETRVTAHDGDSTMDLTQKSNLTIQNHPNQQCVSAMNSSNYEVSGGTKKIVIHQVETTTLTTVATVFAEGSNGATLSFGSFPGFDMKALPSFEGFQGFKIHNPLSELRYISLKAPQAKVSAVKDVARASNAARKGNTDNRSNGNEKPDGKQSTNKPSRVVQKPPKKMTSRNAPHDSEDEENMPIVISSSSDESVGEVQSPPNHGTNGQNILTSSKSKSKASECAPRTLGPKNRTVSNGPRSVAKEATNEETIVISTSSEDSPSKPSSDLTKPKTQPQSQPAARKGILPECPKVSVQSEKYFMSLDCQKRLTVGGHCRYSTEGTVIYRPRRIQANLPQDAKKIEITKQDLDLSAVASESKRKKFENFKRRIHPNSTVVYYMSDSEADDELSDDDDDPLAAFHPFVVFEYAHHGV